MGQEAKIWGSVVKIEASGFKVGAYGVRIAGLICL